MTDSISSISNVVPSEQIFREIKTYVAEHIGQKKKKQHVAKNRGIKVYKLHADNSGNHTDL
mgnify:CR=1 FL=1